MHFAFFHTEYDWQITTKGNNSIKRAITYQTFVVELEAFTIIIGNVEMSPGISVA
jgi:hypothetical protein